MQAQFGRLDEVYETESIPEDLRDEPHPDCEEDERPLDSRGLYLLFYCADHWLITFTNERQQQHRLIAKVASNAFHPLQIVAGGWKCRYAMFTATNIRGEEQTATCTREASVTA
jgi:hypothetical protein